MLVNRAIIMDLRASLLDLAVWRLAGENSPTILTERSLLEFSDSEPSLETLRAIVAEKKPNSVDTLKGIANAFCEVWAFHKNIRQESSCDAIVEAVRESPLPIQSWISDEQLVGYWLDVLLQNRDAVAEKLRLEQLSRMGKMKGETFFVAKKRDIGIDVTVAQQPSETQFSGLFKEAVLIRNLIIRGPFKDRKTGAIVEAAVQTAIEQAELKLLPTPVYELSLRVLKCYRPRFGRRTRRF